MVGVEPLRLYFLRTDSGPWRRKSHSVEALRLEIFYIDIVNLVGGRIKMARKSLLFSIVRRSQYERMLCKFGRVEQDHEARGI
jgi:hypothetical protein